MRQRPFRPGSFRRPDRLVIVLAAALVAGCGFAPVGADGVKGQAQAAVALDQWDAAVAAAGSGPFVVPVGDLTGQIGDWEPAVGGDNKVALMSGLVEAASILPGAARPDGEVQWPDGTTTRVPVMSAQDALVAVRRTAAAPCGDCKRLIATGATLIAGPIQTSRGPATGPIWSFTIQGTAVAVTRVAIANALTVPPLPWDPSVSSIGLRIDSATGSISGKEITVTFVGAPETGDKPCGEDYSTTAVESKFAVVVIVTAHAHLTVGGCSAVGATRTAIATLADPLGERVLLNIDDGQPVPMVVSP